MFLTIDGKRVFAATGGLPPDPALPAVVFVHGAGMDHSVWALLTRYFAHHGRSVLAVDLPGHGRSDGAPLDSIAALADWLAALIPAAGFAQAALAGHSMGALAALDAAARHPDRVRAIALLGVAARMPVHPDLLALAAADDPAARDMVNVWAFGARAERGGSRAPGLWMIGGGRALLDRGNPGVLSTDLIACNAYDGAAAAAAGVSCPALLVLGERDRMTPAKAGHALAAAISGARTVVLPGGGHMMMVEQPDPVRDALAEVL
jgi:pimeloyl-ACP methyl ester carboxylesterase